ncbi:hypothetical protein [Nitrospira moscoviensis]|uniref:Uncharacterized protein n=1 Tax=Nitrospira moscoviensis TaxID=42253 RepID=A0A0K2GGC0_NITMO|nr:hypothetical protein [Nitrospira moscoviensis]ALA59672.1 hypothetical protein NITMOv2_3279 [Nitrospira moscoviensis]
MQLFLLLIMGGAFLGMCRRTMDGLLWAGVLLIVFVVLASLFPDSGLRTAIHTVLPFSLQL